MIFFIKAIHILQSADSNAFKKTGFTKLKKFAWKTNHNWRGNCNAALDFDNDWGKVSVTDDRLSLHNSQFKTKLF
jgi:hypothetical protein